MSLDPILWAVVFVYLWLCVQPPLLFHAFGTLLPGAIPFSTGRLFAAETSSMPAAGVVYLTGLLSQGYARSLLGAAIIALVTLMLAELTRLHFALAGIRRGAFLTRLPAVAYVLLVSQYHHVLAASLTVCMGLLFSLVFEKVPCRRAPVRIGLYGLLAALGYAVMGAGGVAVFALMTVVHGARDRRRVVVALPAIPIALAVVWGVSEYVYLLPYRDAFRTATPWAPRMMAGFETFSVVLLVALYVYTPIMVPAIVGGKVLIGKIKPAHHRSTKDKRKAHAPKHILVATRFAATLLLPTVLLVAGLLWSHNALRRSLFQIHAAARQKQWSHVLDLARALPKGRNHIACNHYVNRALYHTGRLSYEMFSFPQDPDALLLTRGGEPSPVAQLQLTEVHAELGNANMAEKIASEFLAVQGSFAPIVEMLAWINIIKGQDETAVIYLNALKTYPGYRDAAVTMLDGIRHGFGPDQAGHIDALRLSVPAPRYDALYGGAVEPMLLDLFRRNPRNKMAFEYLMACYLLTRQVERVVAGMEHLRELGYDEVPTHYQEAALVYFGARGQKVDLAKLGIRRDTYQRYLRFVQLERATRSTQGQEALNRLIAEFGTSYYFFFQFGRVGATQSI